jgi:predicted PurR-regulated permease PerM
MSEVIFSEESATPVRQPERSGVSSGLAEWLMKVHIVKTAAAANTLMLIVAGISVSIAILVPFIMNSGHGLEQTITDGQLQFIGQHMNR